MNIYWKILLLIVEATELITGLSVDTGSEEDTDVQAIDRRSYDLGYQAGCCGGHQISGRTYHVPDYKPPKNKNYGAHSRPNSKMFFFGKRNQQDGDEIPANAFINDVSSQVIDKEKKLKEDWKKHLNAVDQLYNMKSYIADDQSRDGTSLNKKSAEVPTMKELLEKRGYDVLMGDAK